MRTCVAVLSALLVMLLSGCAVIQRQIDAFNDNASPGIIDGINSWIEEQGLDPEATKLRAGILSRAESWIVLGVPYGSFDKNLLNDYYDGYRADCSGFVSMAWQLKDASGKKVSPSTATLENYAVEIPFEELLPGDAINNKGGGEHGHVVLFVSWLNDDHTKFVAFEENGGYGKAVQTELTLQERADGSYTIEEYDAVAPGPYYAQSYSAPSE